MMTLMTTAETDPLNEAHFTIMPVLYFLLFYYFYMTFFSFGPEQ